MFKFVSKNLPAFGLEISGNSLKILELGKKGSQFTLKACHNTPLPKGLVVNDAITDLKTFDYLLHTALQKPQLGKVGSSYVVASLPESKSFVRVIQIPQMSDSEAENAVPYEAESFIPLPIDQVYLDWQKIGNVGEKMNILMIASPKDFVDKYLEFLDKAGLKPVALEVESQSCHRALIAPGSDETTLIIDIGASRSSLLMVEAGNLQFTSTIPIAGNTFTESIAKSLGVASAKAEEIKKKVGLSNTPEYPNIQTASLPALNNLTEEIKNILRFHGEHSEKTVSQVLLTGGGAAMKNLAEILGEQLRDAGVAQTLVADPWKNLAGLQSALPAGIEPLGLTTTVGLAMRGVSFEVS